MPCPHFPLPLPFAPLIAGWTLPACPRPLLCRPRTPCPFPLPYTLRCAPPCSRARLVRLSLPRINSSSFCVCGHSFARLPSAFNAHNASLTLPRLARGLLVGPSPSPSPRVNRPRFCTPYFALAPSPRRAAFSLLPMPAAPLPRALPAALTLHLPICFTFAGTSFFPLRPLPHLLPLPVPPARGTTLLLATLCPVAAVGAFV